MTLPIGFADIAAARDRIAGHVHRTPVVTSRALDELTGARLFLKCENLQRVGAFKARGAMNAVLSLTDEAAARGVVTHSSGNHGAAVALAARTRGIPAAVVIPEGAPQAKVDQVVRLGARVHRCPPGIPAREAAVRALMEQREGAAFVHPYADPLVMAGQGTAAVELIEDAGPLDAVLAPVGGGGLLSGTAVAARHLAPSIRVLAAEPAQADDAFRSWSTGALTPGDPPDTIADGLRGTLADTTFAVLRALVDEFAIVSEAAIVAAMRLCWETTKLVIEPSAAVPLAALLDRGLDVAGLRVGVVLTGGNVDLDRLPWATGAA